jgi:P pilus assembly chaperone PapD
MKFTRSIGSLLIAAMAGLYLQPAHAQSVSISPTVIEAQAQRGQASTSITITNTDNEPFRAKLYLLDFSYNKERGFEIVNRHSNSAIPYLSFSPKELDIPPGATRKVRMDLVMPPSVPDGEYRSVLYVEDLKERSIVDDRGVETKVKFRLGSQLFVRKNDGNTALVPNLKITNAFWNLTDRDIVLQFQNQGGATALVGTAWKIQQGGKLIASGKVDGTIVLGNSERLSGINLPIAVPKGLSPGQYQLMGDSTYRVSGNNRQLYRFTVNFAVPEPTAVPTPAPAPAPKAIDPSQPQPNLMGAKRFEEVLLEGLKKSIDLKWIL